MCPLFVHHGQVISSVKNFHQKKRQLEFYFWSQIQEEKVKGDAQRQKAKFSHKEPPMFWRTTMWKGLSKNHKLLAHHSNDMMVVNYLHLELYVHVCGKEMRKLLFKGGATMTYKQLIFFFQLIETYKTKNTWKKLLETYKPREKGNLQQVCHATTLAKLTDLKLGWSQYAAQKSQAHGPRGYLTLL